MTCMCLCVCVCVCDLTDGGSVGGDDCVRVLGSEGRAVQVAGGGEVLAAQVWKLGVRSGRDHRTDLHPSWGTPTTVGLTLLDLPS